MWTFEVNVSSMIGIIILGIAWLFGITGFILLWRKAVKQLDQKLDKVLDKITKKLEGASR